MSSADLLFVPRWPGRVRRNEVVKRESDGSFAKEGARGFRSHGQPECQAGAQLKPVANGNYAPRAPLSASAFRGGFGFGPPALRHRRLAGMTVGGRARAPFPLPPLDISEFGCRSISRLGDLEPQGLRTLPPGGAPIHDLVAGVQFASCGSNSRTIARANGCRRLACSTRNRPSMRITSSAAYRVSPVTQRLVVNSRIRSPRRRSQAQGDDFVAIAL